MGLLLGKYATPLQRFLNAPGPWKNMQRFFDASSTLSKIIQRFSNASSTLLRRRSGVAATLQRRRSALKLTLGETTPSVSKNKN